MAITAVSGVKLTGNGYNTTFTGKKKTHKNAEYPQHSNIGSNALKSVPIIVMLTMTPAELSCGTRPQYVMPAVDSTEVLAQIPSNNISTIDLRNIQAPEEVDYPLGCAYLKGRPIREIVPATSSGRSANLVLMGTKSDTSSVYSVFYIDSEKQDGNSHHYPPQVQGLVYHNLGEDKEFLGITLREYLYHNKSEPDKVTGILYRETRLDDKSAQYLLDFRTDDTKWINKTDITFEVTDSPKVMSPKIY